MLLVLTPALSWLPKVATAAVVITVIIRLVEVGEVVRLWRTDKRDFVVAVAVFAVVIFADVAPGLVTGMVLQWLVGLTRGFSLRSPVEVWTRHPDGWRQVTHALDASTALEPAVGKGDAAGDSESVSFARVAVVRFQPDLQFHHAARLESHLDEVGACYRPAATVVDLHAVASADSGGCVALLQAGDDNAAAGRGPLIVAGANRHVVQRLLRACISRGGKPAAVLCSPDGGHGGVGAAIAAAVLNARRVGGGTAGTAVLSPGPVVIPAAAPSGSLNGGADAGVSTVQLPLLHHDHSGNGKHVGDASPLATTGSVVAIVCEQVVVVDGVEIALAAAQLLCDRMSHADAAEPLPSHSKGVPGIPVSHVRARFLASRRHREPFMDALAAAGAGTTEGDTRTTLLPGAAATALSVRSPPHAGVLESALRSAHIRTAAFDEPSGTGIHGFGPRVSGGEAAGQQTSTCRPVAGAVTRVASVFVEGWRGARNVHAMLTESRPLLE